MNCLAQYYFNNDHFSSKKDDLITGEFFLLFSFTIPDPVTKNKDSHSVFTADSSKLDQTVSRKVLRGLPHASHHILFSVISQSHCMSERGVKKTRLPV